MGERVHDSASRAKRDGCLARRAALGTWPGALAVDDAIVAQRAMCATDGGSEVASVECVGEEDGFRLGVRDEAAAVLEAPLSQDR